MSDSPRDDDRERRPRRPGGAGGSGSGHGRGDQPRGGRPGGSGSSGRSSDRRPDRAAGQGRPARPGAPKDSSRGGARPGRDEERLWTREGKPARGDRAAKDLPPEDDGYDTRMVRPHHDDPPIPDSVTPKSLDRVARNELKTLTAENQEFVARHLAMAAQLIDEDPALAHRHALSASRRGGRIGIVRETLGITAYATGDFALALRELRTYRRLTGRDDQLPMMVDSERGLGRPDRALELGRSVPRASLPVPVQVELAIAMSGARLDLGQPERALEELEIPQLDPTTAYSWSAPLFSAYATVLEDLGRTEEAAQWLRRADLAAEAFEPEDSTDDIVEIVEEEGDDAS